MDILGELIGKVVLILAVASIVLLTLYVLIVKLIYENFLAGCSKKSVPYFSTLIIGTIILLFISPDKWLWIFLVAMGLIAVIYGAFLNHEGNPNFKKIIPDDMTGVIKTKHGTIERIPKTQFATYEENFVPLDKRGPRLKW